MAVNEAQKAPPRENLIRAQFPADIEVRDNADEAPTLRGHFAVFNEWTEIDSVFEGRFLERIAPGAFKKTFKENRDSMKVLFQHGRDPQIGDKVLGSISSLEEDSRGAAYEVPLFDTSYNKDLIPGLRAGEYGASFRFRVIREDINDQPDLSEHNPRGLPERTISEAQVMEFGPVTFPAYDGATAQVRSMTDEFLTGRFAAGARSEDEKPLSEDGGTIATETEDAPPHPAEDEPRRDTQPEASSEAETSEERNTMSIEEMRARVDEIAGELKDIATENGGRVLDAEVQARWDTLVQDRENMEAALHAHEERMKYIDSISDKPGAVESGSDVFVTKRPGRDQTPEDPFELAGYHGRANSHEQLMRLYQDGAKKAVETFHYPHGRAKKEDVNDHLERLLHNDGVEREIAQRMIVFGSPTYRSAFWKTLRGQPLTREEQSAMAAGAQLEARAMDTSNTGGVTVPIQIDPTVIPTSNGVLNPFRQVSRIETTTSYIWQGVTSGGITAQYRAEGTHMTDGTPTLVPRPIQPERADAFVPFSWEAGQDWQSLEANLASAIQDSKDALEATKFAVGAGHGSNEPQGVLVGAGTLVGSAGATAFASADVYALEIALPPRYQPNASWLATSALFQKVRQFATAAGPGVWADSLVVGNPPTLLGYPAYKASTVGTAGSALTSSARWGVFGDFSRYVIVDRIGLSVRVIPDLFGGTAAVHYPTGQSGLVAYWRNSAGVIDSNAFRVGTIT